MLEERNPLQTTFRGRDIVSSRVALSLRPVEIGPIVLLICSKEQHIGLTKTFRRKIRVFVSSNKMQRKSVEWVTKAPVIGVFSNDGPFPRPNKIFPLGIINDCECLLRVMKMGMVAEEDYRSER